MMENKKMTTELIRPSALPKLACCRCYVSQSSTSEAAERGTRLDAIIRGQWLNPSPVEGLSPGEYEAEVIFTCASGDSISEDFDFEVRK